MSVMQRKALPGHQRGVGIIELMISITVGLVILAGVVQIYSTTIHNQKSQEGSSRIQENLRYIFKRLEEDIAHAGYTGCFPYQGDKIAVLLGNEVGTGQLYDFDGSYIVGTNDDGMLGTDTLTVRYASTRGRIPLARDTNRNNTFIQVADASGLQQYQIVMLGDCSRAAVFMITSDTSEMASGQVDFALGVTSPKGKLNAGQFNNSTDMLKQFYAEASQTHTRAFLYSGSTGAHTYSIDTSAAGVAEGEVCSQASANYCALFRDGQELVEGVEDFQLLYGAEDSAGNVTFFEANGVSDWMEVDRVQMTITFNSIENTGTNEGAGLMTRTASKTVMIRNKLASS